MRKNILILALLLCGGFSLAAQSRPDASIYVTPVTGNGSKSDDNSFFYKQLVQEITNQDFNLAKTQKSANYTLIGSLDRYAFVEGQYAFHLELRENKTGELKVEGDLLYESPEDARQQFPFLVSSLLYTIPVDNIAEGAKKTEDTEDTEGVEKTEDWRDKLVYLGIAATWTPRFYVGSAVVPYYGSPHGGISAEFHFVNFMSFEIGAELAVDEIKPFVNKTDVYHDIMIEFPFLLKFVIKPGSYFMLEPYLGPQINIPYPGNTNLPMFSGLVGFQFGVKVGPGVLFFDGRFGMDFAKSGVGSSANNNRFAYQRFITHLGLGYKFGLLQRKIK